MIYIRRSDGVLATFEGMSMEAITVMLGEQGMTCDELTADEYNAAVLKASGNG